MVVADCPGGEAIVVQIDGINEVISKTWCATLLCADAQGRMCVRSVRGSALTSAAQQAGLDQDVVVGYQQQGPVSRYH